MGIFAQPGEKLRLRNYSAGFRPKATPTGESYNTRLTLWYVVNSSPALKPNS